MKNSGCHGNQSIMVFIKSHLQRNSLFQCSRLSGISDGSTSVDWGSFVHEISMEHFQRHTKNKILTGENEIDESLFERIKYHRSNPSCGLKIGVFGMVERSSNSLILYPVCDHSEKVSFLLSGDTLSQVLRYIPMDGVHT